MKKILTLFFAIAFALTCQGEQTTKFNFGFENQKAGNVLSDGWIKWGNYKVAIDSSLVYSGKKSGKITSNSSGNFGGIACKICGGNHQA